MARRRELELQDQGEFERSIAGDFSENRDELTVDQVSPVHSPYHEALIRVRAGREDEARLVHMELSERVQRVLTLLEGEALARQHPRLDQGGVYLRVGHESDRTYAGYANIYRGIKALAPYLEDARFFISEMYSPWVDEYRIAGGALSFCRGDAGEDSAAAVQRHFEARMADAPGDAELRRFVARQLLNGGRHELDTAERTAPGKPERAARAKAALAAIERALELDPDSAPAWHKKARALALIGRGGEAAGCLERALALAPDPALRQELALTAFAERRDREALEQLEQIAEQERSKLAWQVVGLLRRRAADDVAAARAFDAALARGPVNPDNEALLRTGRADELLGAFWDRAEQRVREGTGSFEHVAADMVHWAEFFRVKMHHGFDAPGSRQRALALYDRAVALGDPGGAAHYWKGMLFKLTDGPTAAEPCLRAAAERGHAQALGELGSLLLERKEVGEAIALLKAYLGRTTGGYERGVRANQLLAALYERANHLLEQVGDYRAAEAAFDEVIALQASGSYSMRSFEGAWVGKSNARAWLGDHAAALQFAEKGLELNAKSAYAWSAKGSALNNLGRFAEAMPCYETAIAADPKYWHPYYCKACTLALTGGELGEIVGLLREFLRRAPERRGLLRTEPDFVGLRGVPEFDALVEGAPAKRRR